MNVCLMPSSTAVQVAEDGVLAVGTTQQGRTANGAEKTSTDHLLCFPATTAAVTLWVRFALTKTQIHCKMINRDKKYLSN